MNIALLHLTDIHFSIKTDFSSRIHAFCQSVIREITNTDVLYIIVSGDIAFSGSKDEYHSAKGFLSTVKQLLKGQYGKIDIRFLMVPGNHDCNFNGDSQVRKTILNNVGYHSFDDSSIASVSLALQDDFWSFYKEYQPEPKDKVFYQVRDIIDGKSVTFHCINTAWMSSLNEEPGSLFFPAKKYEPQIQSRSHLDIGIWHHPYNWFNPNTTENNKKEFERFTEKIASTHFLGHEHEQGFHNNKNRETGDWINLLEGEVFNDDKKKQISGFQIVVFDLDQLIGTHRKYKWNGTYYLPDPEKEIILRRDYQRSFNCKDDFLKDLELIKIPFAIEGRKSIKQTDIFVFPDLEPSNNEIRLFDNYVNSARLLERDLDSCVIDGEGQMGKTTLLSMLYLQFYENGCFPISMTGRNITEPNILKIAKRYFRHQYGGVDEDFEKYLQLPKDKRILLIDDFQDCNFNSETARKFYDECAQRFGKVIVMMDAASGIIPSMRTEFTDVQFYSMKPLGYKKRNELIERYLLLQENPNTRREDKLLEKLERTFDTVQSILGDKLMPSFPIYILSILQALEYKPLQNETSYAYCYQTLIHYSLHKAGVANDEIDAYFNFLTELAFKFISQETEWFNKQALFDFYHVYQKEYICPTYDALMKVLTKSNIIQEEEGGMRFTYNYILYYLSAKKIADVIHTTEGKKIVKKLFDDVHVEHNANILVFITHHSKDVSFIEDCLFKSMEVLEDNTPITLERDDPFYNEILELTEQIKNDILESNRNPVAERNKMLAKRDEHAAKIQTTREEIAESDVEQTQKLTMPFKQAFRSIEIVGQIVRNRKGSLTKPQLESMITELYTTGFRTVSYISNLLSSTKGDIIEHIRKETNDSEDAREIEKRLTQFIQIASLDTCIGVFGKLMRCAGNKDLKSIYLQVAKNLNTAAAKLLTFGINSYYGTVAVEDVKVLAEEFKNNTVAMQLLRSRVKGYVYHKHVDFKTKQKLASLLNMTLSAGPAYDQEKSK